MIFEPFVMMARDAFVSDPRPSFVASSNGREERCCRGKVLGNGKKLLPLVGECASDRSNCCSNESHQGPPYP